jgi:uncharacterized membrane protein YdbT with pleckstrin-like domain
VKTLNFSKTSWHFCIATKLGGYVAHYDADDICTYSKHFMIGLVTMFAIAMGIAILGFLAWNFIFGVIFSLVYWTWLFNDLAYIVIFAIIGLIFTCLLIGGSWWIVYGEPMIKQDSFVRNAYKSWKEKYCIKIDFTGTHK